jgi:hypothetical protein
MSNKPFLEERLFESAEEFLNYLRPSEKCWGSEWDSPWIFRGHADADWALLPPLLRADGRVKVGQVLEEISTRLARWTLGDFEAALSDAVRVREQDSVRIIIDRVIRDTEYYAVTKFAELADELGLTVDGQEKWRLPDFEGPSVATALAQHHGVPTSLLDWTHKPMIAAHFAAVETINATHLAVWALNTNEACDPPGLRARGLKVFRVPRSTHPYLHAQAGLFTWMEWQHRFNFLANLGRWPTVLDVIEYEHDPGAAPCVRKLSVPRSEVATLRRLLWRERVSRAHLMPSFDNVSQALFSRWESELIAEGGANLPGPRVWTTPDKPNPFLPNT